LALAVNGVFAGWLRERGLFLVPMAAVFVSATYGGLGPGLMATMLLALGTWFFFLALAESFYLLDPQDLFWVALFVALGAVVSLMGETLLVTRQRYAEAAAARERTLAKLDSLFDSASVGLVLLDSELRFTRVNRLVAEATGVTEAAHVGRHIQEILPGMPDDMIRRYQHVLDTGESMAPREVVLTVPGQPGLPRHWLLSASPIRSRQGTILGVGIVRVDVTESRRAELALEESQQRLQTVLQTLPVGVILADRQGQLITVNDAAKTIWGGGHPLEVTSFERCKGWHVDSEKPIAPDEWGYARVLANGEAVVSTMIEIECLDGTRKTVTSAAVPLRDGTNDLLGVVVVEQDVTALRQAESEARQAVADREELLAIVSHDLKNPLTAILLNAGVIQQRAPEAARQADGILRAGAQMQQLIANILDVNRARQGHLSLILEPVSVWGLVNEVIDTLKPQAAIKSLRIVRDVASDIGDVTADRSRLLQVLSNLVGNAIKFTPERGTITVAAAVSGSDLILRVQDTGPGIAADQQAKIFERFWQAKKAERQGHGAGLGLAIAKGIVEAHHGRIAVSSAVGHGATFTVTLPLHGVEARQSA
jgi:PAS domain S-box-containing protein